MWLTKVDSKEAGAARDDGLQAVQIFRQVHVLNDSCSIMPQQQAHQVQQLGRLLSIQVLFINVCQVWYGQQLEFICLRKS